MTVAIAGRAPATFEIKSANLPLVALLLKSHDLGAIARELQARFGDIPAFFDNDPLVIDLSPLKAQDEAPLDFPALLGLLRGYRVMPVAARGGSAAQMEAALKAGLAAAEDAAVGGQGHKPAQPERQPAPPERPAPAAEMPQRQLQLDPSEWHAARPEGQGIDPEQHPGEPDTHARAHPPVQPGALVIDKPLRSGQQVYARGRDLVVLSMVNPGAEVIADGHIHVWAPLRGKAIAGARGNTEARIIALSLEPELISIAGVYRTSDVPLAAEVLGRPTQVRLVGGTEGKLVMDALLAPSPARGRG